MCVATIPMCYYTVMRKRHEHAHLIRTHASKKLQLNLRILAVVYSVLLIITLYELIVSMAIFWQVILAIIIGLIAGIISSRMYKIAWDKDESKVVGKIDIYGGVVLVLFIVFELNRSHIAGLFASSESIGAIGLVLITATLFGRIIGTSRKIIAIIQR